MMERKDPRAGFSPAALLGTPLRKFVSAHKKYGMEWWLLIIGTLITFTMVGLIPLAGSLTGLIVLIFIRSFGAALSMPASAALSISLGRRFGMGSTIGLVGLATSVGMAAGPFLAGVTHDYLGGISSVFYFAAGVGFIGIAFFAWLSHKEEPAEPASEEESSSPRAGVTS